MKTVSTALLISLLCCQSGFAKQGAALQPKLDTTQYNTPSEPPNGTNGGSPTMRLQGSAQVLQVFNKDVVNWQATQYYRQGAFDLAIGDAANAAALFKIAADGFGMTGEGRAQAQCRFAQAQVMRVLLKQQAQAAPVYKLAADLFAQFDPTSAYLKACLDLSKGKEPVKLKGKAAKTGKELLLALPAMADSVSRNIVLKGKVAELADGTKLEGLKDEQVFTVGKPLPAAAAVNVSDACVKDAIYKAFYKMTCLEMAALGGNYYTAPGLYHSFKADGKTVVVGKSDDVFSPVLKLKLNGHEYGILMDLPGASASTKVVLPVTDGEHVLAIDLRTNDTWKLQAIPSQKAPDFDWWKLTHVKNGVARTP